MPTEDANKWNIRYKEDPRNSFELPRSLLIEHAHFIPTQGLALDLAMGLGGNARFLLQRGLRVIGVDISFVAVKNAHTALPDLMAIVADLQDFCLPTEKFDLIIDFLYLQRDLWLPIIHGLKIGGVLFIECLTEDMLSTHPEINPAFLLKTGELQQTFLLGELAQHVEIVYYFEGRQASSTPRPRSVASLIARRYA
jgi:hypothetical protein